MRFCLNTDCLGYMPFEEMLDTVAALGYESIEIACGNWSKAPHIDLDAMLASEETRKNYMDAIAKRGLVLEVLNCSGDVYKRQVCTEPVLSEKCGRVTAEGR